MDKALVYAGPIVTLIAGVFAFFWAKDGQRQKISGLGWIALSCLIAGTAISLMQVHRNQRAIERAKVDELEAVAQSRSAHNRLIATQTATFSGFDRNVPFQNGSFYFDVGRNQDGSVIEFPGFVGPFPRLRTPQEGTLKFGLSPDFDYEFSIVPHPSGVALSSSDSRVFVLTESRHGPVFQHPRHDDTRSADLDGTWEVTGEDYDYGYFVSINSSTPMRGIITRIAENTNFGQLTFTLPGSTDSERRTIASNYEKIMPAFVFLAKPDAAEEVAESCIIRVRVPLRLVRTAAPEEGLNFEIRASEKGFNMETCGYVP